MISDASRTLTVQYTYSNRPKFINFANRTLRMKYNPFGYRFFSGESNQDGDVFLYSSQGQLVAKYKISGNALKLNYLPIYEGSKRIGIVEPSGVSWLDCPELMLCGLVAIDPCMLMVEGQPKPPCKKDSSFKADRKYEIVDHLGNVRVVIANQRVPVDTDGDSLVDYYKPLVKEISDYYPYGWVKFYGNYEFGANAGSLFEDWDSTRGTYYTLYRLLDSRIARWYQVEPLWESYAWMSGYVVNMNNPIVYVDTAGDFPFVILGVAVVSALTSGGLEIANQMILKEKKWSEIEWENVWISVGVGFVGGLVGGFGLGKLIGGAAGSLAGAAAGRVAQAIGIGVRHVPKVQIIVEGLVFVGFDMGTGVGLGYLERTLKDEETNVFDVVTDALSSIVGEPIENAVLDMMRKQGEKGGEVWGVALGELSSIWVQIFGQNMSLWGDSGADGGNGETSDGVSNKDNKTYGSPSDWYGDVYYSEEERVCKYPYYLYKGDTQENGDDSGGNK